MSDSRTWATNPGFRWLSLTSLGKCCVSLLRLRPVDIKRWLAMRAFVVPNPNLQTDRPHNERSFLLCKVKSGVSVFMPNQHVGWNWWPRRQPHCSQNGSTTDQRCCCARDWRSWKADEWQAPIPTSRMEQGVRAPPERTGGWVFGLIILSIRLMTQTISKLTTLLGATSFHLPSSQEQDGVRTSGPWSSVQIKLFWPPVTGRTASICYSQTIWSSG